VSLANVKTPKSNGSFAIFEIVDSPSSGNRLVLLIFWSWYSKPRVPKMVKPVINAKKS
jgi:hypothetical protein